MPLVPPAQIAALIDAATDSRGQLRRTRGPRGAGYVSDHGPEKYHTPVTVCALHREGLLTEVSPGFQSVYVITEAGRRVASSNQRLGLVTGMVSA